MRKKLIEWDSMHVPAVRKEGRIKSIRRKGIRRSLKLKGNLGFPAVRKEGRIKSIIRRGQEEPQTGGTSVPAVRKGINPILSSVLVFLTVVIAATIVLNIGNEAIESSKKASSIKDAQNAMFILDNAIKEVSSEGIGAKRSVRISYPGKFESIPGEDAIQFESVQGMQLFEYLSREFKGNFARISGGDVSCDDSGNLTVENTFLKLQLRNIPETSPMASINTTEILISLGEKANSTEIAFINSSVVIDDNLSTANGTGYTEISNKGKFLPFCQVHAFVNSTKSYDIYYRLYAGADFIVIDVKNVKEKT